MKNKMVLAIRIRVVNPNVSPYSTSIATGLERTTPAPPFRDHPPGFLIRRGVTSRRFLGIAYAFHENRDAVHSPKVVSDVWRNINQSETSERTRRKRIQRDWCFFFEWPTACLTRHIVASYTRTHLFCPSDNSGNYRRPPATWLR